jgi:hypothetical protein
MNNLVWRHSDDLAIDDLFHALHFRKRKPLFLGERLGSCRHDFGAALFLVYAGY